MLSVALGIAVFFCFLFAFRYGLSLGMRAAKDKEIPQIRNPVQVVQDAVKRHKEEERLREIEDAWEAFDDGFTNEERAIMRQVAERKNGIG